MSVIAFTIPGLPTPFARAGASGKRRYTPRRQADFMAAVRMFAAQAMRSRPPLVGPVEMTVHASYVAPTSWSSRKRAETVWRAARPDSDNLAKLVADSLNGIAFADDAQICRLIVVKTYGDAAQTHVTVRSLDNSHHEFHADIKFAKGEWLNGDKVINGVRMTAQMHQLMRGWRKWSDGKIVDVDIGFVADGFSPKLRSELDDLEASAWPLNARGERSDPWQEGYYLRFINEEDGSSYVWAATSAGAKMAVGNLAGKYSQRGRRSLPTVALNAGFFRHSQYGKIDKPVLDVVGWTEPAGNVVAFEKRPALPPAQTTTDVDDDIPF